MRPERGGDVGTGGADEDGLHDGVHEIAVLDRSRDAAHDALLDQHQFVHRHQSRMILNHVSAAEPDRNHPRHVRFAMEQLRNQIQRAQLVVSELVLQQQHQTVERCALDAPRHHLGGADGEDDRIAGGLQEGAHRAGLLLDHVLDRREHFLHSLSALLGVQREILQEALDHPDGDREELVRGKVVGALGNAAELVEEREDVEDQRLVGDVVHDHVVDVVQNPAEENRAN